MTNTTRATTGASTPTPAEIDRCMLVALLRTCALAVEAKRVLQDQKDFEYLLPPGAVRCLDSTVRARRMWQEMPDHTAEVLSFVADALEAKMEGGQQ